jgi:hypothetical protein
MEHDEISTGEITPAEKPDEKLELSLQSTSNELDNSTLSTQVSNLELPIEKVNEKSENAVESFDMEVSEQKILDPNPATSINEIDNSQTALEKNLDLISNTETEPLDEKVGSLEMTIELTEIEKEPQVELGNSQETGE